MMKRVSGLVALLVIILGGWLALRGFARKPTLEPAAAVSQPPLLATTSRPAATPLPIQQPSATPQGLPIISNSSAIAMLPMINADRRAAGLQPVVWDEFAAKVAAAHAKEMAEQGYLSHWNRAGQGPDIRYGLAGGTDDSMENAHSSSGPFLNGTPVLITDWDEQLKKAQTGLMNSPGHRANILLPAHTHVGVGTYYHAPTGEFRLVQLFINRYVSFSPLPRIAKQGDVINIEGTLLSNVTNLILRVAYEPNPTPMTIAQLNTTHTYESPAVDLSVTRPTQSGNKLSAAYKVDTKGKAGLLHLQVFADVNGKQAQVTDAIIEIK